MRVILGAQLAETASQVSFRTESRAFSLPPQIGGPRTLETNPPLRLSRSTRVRPEGSGFGPGSGALAVPRAIFMMRLGLRSAGPGLGLRARTRYSQVFPATNHRSLPFFRTD
jgi:hypothetical protein